MGYIESRNRDGGNRRRLPNDGGAFVYDPGNEHLLTRPQVEVVAVLDDTATTLTVSAPCRLAKVEGEGVLLLRINDAYRSPDDHPHLSIGAGRSMTVAVDGELAHVRWEDGHTGEVEVQATDGVSLTIEAGDRGLTVTGSGPRVWDCDTDVIDDLQEEAGRETRIGHGSLTLTANLAGRIVVGEDVRLTEELVGGAVVFGRHLEAASIVESVVRHIPMPNSFDLDSTLPADDPRAMAEVTSSTGSVWVTGTSVRAVGKSHRGGRLVGPWDVALDRANDAGGMSGTLLCDVASVGTNGRCAPAPGSRVRGDLIAASLWIRGRLAASRIAASAFDQETQVRPCEMLLEKGARVTAIEVHAVAQTDDSLAADYDDLFDETFDQRWFEEDRSKQWAHLRDGQISTEVFRGSIRDVDLKATDLRTAGVRIVGATSTVVRALHTEPLGGREQIVVTVDPSTARDASAVSPQPLLSVHGSVRVGWRPSHVRAVEWKGRHSILVPGPKSEKDCAGIELADIVRLTMGTLPTEEHPHDRPALVRVLRHEDRPRVLIKDWPVAPELIISGTWSTVEYAAGTPASILPIHGPWARDRIIDVAPYPDSDDPARPWHRMTVAGAELDEVTCHAGHRIALRDRSSNGTPSMIGRIHSLSDPDAGHPHVSIEVPFNGRVDHARITRLVRERLDGAPRDPVPTGELFDCDITGLSYAELDLLEHFESVSPSIHSLRSLSRVTRRGLSTRPHHDLLPEHRGATTEAELRRTVQRRANWAARLLKVVEGRIPPGPRLATVRHTASRLHHVASPSFWERMARQANRVLGYGTDIRAAAITYLAGVFIATMVAWVRVVPARPPDRGSILGLDWAVMELPHWMDRVGLVMGAAVYPLTQIVRGFGGDFGPLGGLAEWQSLSMLVFTAIPLFGLLRAFYEYRREPWS